MPLRLVLVQHKTYLLRKLGILINPLFNIIAHFPIPPSSRL